VQTHSFITRPLVPPHHSALVIVAAFLLLLASLRGKKIGAEVAKAIALALKGNTTLQELL